MKNDGHGWLVETWDDDKGIRFYKGPCDKGISFELLTCGHKNKALNMPLDTKIVDCFSPKEGIDGEHNDAMWWTYFDMENIRILVKRLQTMLDTEEEDNAERENES